MFLDYIKDKFEKIVIVDTEYKPDISNTIPKDVLSGGNTDCLYFLVIFQQSVSSILEIDSLGPNCSKTLLPFKHVPINRPPTFNDDDTLFK